MLSLENIASTCDSVVIILSLITLRLVSVKGRWQVYRWQLESLKTKMLSLGSNAVALERREGKSAGGWSGGDPQSSLLPSNQKVINNTAV